ncbi:chromobox protein homolog 1-like [Scaptodrosophila lebanonensis]|uniref:Chromobox protein homolog 1-like n=1 Tax=Drosophila lebanonensis TaxID=7225 RepID=A0A6J2T7E2_DROLE|nr:chromobox protein homolog 1-like [Scaptodrosophila lebanonensis]
MDRKSSVNVLPKNFANGSVEERIVEKVMDSRVVNGRRQYKIKWAGFGDSYISWEPVERINATLLLAQYEAGLHVNEQALQGSTQGTGQGSGSDAKPSGTHANSVHKGNNSRLFFNIKKRAMPVGIERGWKLKEVVGKVIMWGETFYFVWWEGVDEPETVRREDIIDLYPELLIKFYEGLKICDE